MLSDNSNFCRICGLDQGAPPWGEDGISPTYWICSCCGTEFGYEDTKLSAIKKNRAKWIANGAQWFDKKVKPPNWSLEEQMQQIPEKFR